MKTIEKKIKAVQERIKRLERLSERINSFSEYQTSPDMKDIAERNLQVAIEGCLDIGKIVISAKEMSEPKDNKGVFTVLAEAEILSDKSINSFPLFSSRLIPYNVIGAQLIMINGDIVD